MIAKASSSNDSALNYISFIIFLPIFIPTFGSGFINGIEELPWFLMLLPFIGSWKKIDLTVMLSVVIIALCQAIYLKVSETIILINAIKLLNFLSPIMLLWTNNIIDTLSKAAGVALFLNIIVSLLQYFGIYDPFYTIHDLFFSRSTSALDGSYRGVSGFYSEPARAGYYIALTIFFKNIKYFLGDSSNFKLVSIEIFSYAIFLIIIFSSMTSYFYALVLMSLWFVAIPKKGFFSKGFMLMVFLIFLTTIFLFINTSPKVEMIMEASSLGWQSIYQTLTLVSGGRFFAMEQMILAIWMNPFGSFFNGELFHYGQFESNQVFDGYRQQYRFIATSSILFYTYILGLCGVIYIFLKYNNVFLKPIGVIVLISSLLYSPVSSPFLLIAFEILRKKNLEDIKNE